MSDLILLQIIGVSGFIFSSYMIYRFMHATELDVWLRYKLTGKLVGLPERKDAMSNRGWLESQ